MDRTIPKIEYDSVLEAIRGAAEKYGNGGWREVSIIVPKEKWPVVRAYLKRHGRAKMTEAFLCLCAEVP